MTTVVENRPPDCTACRIFSSIGLVGIGAYLANAAFKNKTRPGKIVVSTFSFAFVTLGVQRYKQQFIEDRWQTDTKSLAKLRYWHPLDMEL